MLPGGSECRPTRALLSSRSGEAADSPVGAVWAWSADGVQPAAPTWERARGSGSVSQVIVPLGSNGGIRVAADRSGPVSLDVAGYVAAGDSSDVHPVVPRSLLKDGAALSKGDATTVSVRGRAGVPSDASAVVVQLAGSSRRDSGRLTLWPRGATAPKSADLVVPGRQARETLVVHPPRPWW